MTFPWFYNLDVLMNYLSIQQPLRTEATSYANINDSQTLVLHILLSKIYFVVKIHLLICFYSEEFSMADWYEEHINL
jgi:hypothetical protein